MNFGKTEVSGFWGFTSEEKIDIFKLTVVSQQNKQQPKTLPSTEGTGIKRTVINGAKSQLERPKSTIAMYQSRV